MKYYYKFFFKLYAGAGKKMCQECSQFIESGSKILDLGCGTGIIGKEFEQFFKARVLGIDIEDRRIIPIPFRLVSDKNLPFKEKEFDVCLISYVLHHCREIENLIKQAKRVTKRIIIFEDLPEGFFSKIICFLHGWSFWLLFQKKGDAVNNFKTEKEWEEIFKKLNLSLIFKKRISNFPVKKELFILGT